jgi:methylenetetrahydrofolate reductase (NADPH)
MQLLQQRQTYGPIPQLVAGRIAQARDAAAEGFALCLETIARLKGLPGVRGIHLLTGGNEPLTARLLKEAGLG